MVGHLYMNLYGTIIPAAPWTIGPIAIAVIAASIGI